MTETEPAGAVEDEPITTETADALSDVADDGPLPDVDPGDELTDEVDPELGSDAPGVQLPADVDRIEP